MNYVMEDFFSSVAYCFETEYYLGPYRLFSGLRSIVFDFPEVQNMMTVEIGEFYEPPPT
jgi:hypothetical protein